MLYASSRFVWKHIFFVSLFVNVTLVALLCYSHGRTTKYKRDRTAGYRGQPDKCPAVAPYPQDKYFDDRVRVGIVIYAIGPNVRLIPNVIKSGKMNFLASPTLKRTYNVTYIVFTNEVEKLKELEDANNVIAVYRKSKGWPLDTLFKYETYLDNSKLFRHFDFIFAMDADMQFVNKVGSEILADLVAAVHPDYYYISDVNSFPYERRVGKSCAAVPSGAGKDYYSSAIFGGRTAFFLAMMCNLVQCTREDFDLETDGRNLIAKMEDESYLNRYFIDHPPYLILSPAYIWQRWTKSPFDPRIESGPKENNVYQVAPHH